MLNNNDRDANGADDGEILQNNNNDSDNDVVIEPSEYEVLREKNIEERNKCLSLLDCRYVFVL